MLHREETVPTAAAATHLVMLHREETVQTAAAATRLVMPLLVVTARTVVLDTPRVQTLVPTVVLDMPRVQTHALTVAAATLLAVMTRAAHLAAKRAVLSPAVTQLVARVRHPRAVATHREETVLIPEGHRATRREGTVAAVMLHAETLVPLPVATPAPLPVEPREAHHAAHPVTHREARPVVARQVENRVPAHTAPRNTRLAKQARLPDPDNKLYNAKRQWLS